MSFCPYVSMYDMLSKFQRSLDPKGLVAAFKQSPSDFYTQMLTDRSFREGLGKEGDRPSGSFLGTLQTAQGRSTAGSKEMDYRFYIESMLYENQNPIFNLYPGIAQALLHTKINIPCNEVEFPFPSFVIRLHKNSGIRLSTGHELCSILVCDDIPSGQDLERGRRRLAVYYQQKVDSPSDAKDTALVQGQYIDVGNFFFVFDLFNDLTVSEALEAMDPGSIEEEDLRIVAKLALGVAFLAIAKDRKYVKRTRIKLYGKDTCFCGSGKTYKKCCKRKGKQKIGFDVGKDIVIQRETKPGTSVVVVGRGKELKYAHMVTGYMRWQWYNDEHGNRKRKLIFIAPTIARPDLPMKPKQTKRAVRRRPEENRRRYNPSLRHNMSGPDVCESCLELISQGLPDLDNEDTEQRLNPADFDIEKMEADINAIISGVRHYGSKKWKIKNRLRATILLWKNSSARWHVAGTVETHIRRKKANEEYLRRLGRPSIKFSKTHYGWDQETRTFTIDADKIIVPYTIKELKPLIDQEDGSLPSLTPLPLYEGSFEHKTKDLGYDPIKGFTVTSDLEMKAILRIRQPELEDLREKRDSLPTNEFINYIIQTYGQRAAFIEDAEPWVREAAVARIKDWVG